MRAALCAQACFFLLYGALSGGAFLAALERQKAAAAADVLLSLSVPALSDYDITRRVE